MFSHVAYPQRNRRDHVGQSQSRPHPLENGPRVGYFDPIPPSPAVITPRERPYNGSQLWRSSQVYTEVLGRDASSVQRTNSFPPRKSDGSPQGRRLDAAEHMLRRKTPSGTLAAGYDASPVEWASGSHAMKDVIVPSSNLNDMHLAPQRVPPDPNSCRSLTTASNHPPEHVRIYGHDGHGKWEAASEDMENMMRLKWRHKSEYSLGMDSFLDQVPGHQGHSYFLPSGQQVPTVMQPTWQPCPGPTASDEPGPYGPYWPNGSFVPYRPAALRDPRFFSHGGRAWIPANEDNWTSDRDRGWQSAVGPPSFTPAKPNEPVPYSHQLRFDRLDSSDVPPSTEYLFRHASSPYALQESRAIHEVNDATRGYQDYLGRAAQHRPPAPPGHDANHEQGSYNGYSSPPTSLVHYDGERPFVPRTGLTASDAHSREKSLSWAHRVYIDLLASLHQSRRASLQAKYVDSRQTLPRANIYPRPPRQPLADFSAQFSDQSSFSNRSLQILDSCRTTREEHISKKPRQGDGSHHRFADALSGRHEVPLCFPSADFPRDHQPDRSYRERLPSATSFQRSTPGGFCTVRRPLGSRPSLHTMPPEQESSSSSSNNAVVALEMLTRLCQESGWLWIDGMLLGGCLAYGLGEYHKASRWYSKILANDPSHVEAMSNLAASLLSLNRREEAEQYWLRSVRLRPSFFEAVEHLIGLLCGDQRGKQAVETIDYVQGALRLDRQSECQKAVDGISETSSEKSRSPSVSISEVSDRVAFDFDLEEDKFIKIGPDADAIRCQPGFGSSGYAIPGSENGRMLALVHAKGNMLYGLGDNAGAAEAFEDAVLIGSGRRQHGIHGLIKRILTVVSHDLASETMPVEMDGLCKDPVLLLPEKALQTSKLVFPAQGELPGLKDVAQGIARRAAISTTSNSLLSLAKIYQDGMSSSAAPASGPRATSGVRDILALYYLSLALQPSPSTANNVGILLASVQPSALFKPPTSSASQGPTIPGVTPGSGIALALAYYNYGLNLDSRHAHLYTNLGSLLKDIGQLTAAIKMYEQAVACDGNFDIALANLANAVKDQGRIKDAIGYYKRAVAASPNFAEAVCGLANALNSVCGWTGRGGVMSDNGKRDQWHVDDQGMPMEAKIIPGNGSGWIKRVVDIVEKQLRDGESWGRGLLQGESLDFVLEQLEAADAGASWPTVKRKSLRNAIQQWTGRSSEGAKAVRLVERATKLLGWWWYQDRYVQKREYRAARYTRPQLPGILAVPSAPTVLPFHTFTCPLSAKQIRKISQRNGLRISCSTLRAPWLSKMVYRPPAPPRPHLNVGYVSSDFNNHPLAHLMQSVFGLHDPSRVKAFCYATTASDNSTHRQQIEREAPRFYDASSWSIDHLVKQIVDDGIHVLVNLNGYTRGARNEVFAARPAPIQMSFMGFAGTLGAEWCDYLLADETAIPPETLRPGRRNVHLEDQMGDDTHVDDTGEWIYSENIIFSRDTFFCCDHRQSAPDSHSKQLSWREEQVRRWRMRKELFPQLTDDQVILGNFNQLYKIDPTTFRNWLRILARLPKAVLWLLRFPELGEDNLQKMAVRWAGSEVASRIIFTDVAPKHQHISRARVCDLFLDTPECNAHTTAADVLWSGTPLLTLPRYKYKMCSRMAASILKGALPKTAEGTAAASELIANSDEEYEERAVALVDDLIYSTEPEEIGRGKGRLVELRKLLYESRWTSALFDTKRWVRDIEAAYAEAWRKWVAREGGDIWL